MPLLAEQHTDRGAFGVGFDVAVKVVDVHLHLAQVLVGELADFQVNQPIATQQAVVKHQIDEKMVVVKGEAFLPGFKQKALAQLQHQRLFQQVLGPADDLPLLGQLANAVFVAAQGQAFVQAAVELALEFAHGPGWWLRFRRSRVRRSS